jgi:hypothetical protein
MKTRDPENLELTLMYDATKSHPLIGDTDRQPLKNAIKPQASMPYNARSHCP